MSPRAPRAVDVTAGGPVGAARAASGGGRPGPSLAAEPLLRLEGLSLSFRGITAVADLDLALTAGAIMAIVGPNGAGKTSVLNCISGFYRPQAGRIRFRGRDITEVPTSRRAGLGIARTFQNVEIYSGMSVVDVIMAGRHLHMRSGLIACGTFLGAAKREEVQNREWVEHLIDFLELGPYRTAVAGALPAGIQKRVALGRALAMEPILLLLDEVTSGMSVEEKRDIARFIGEARADRDITVLLIEHDLSFVGGMAEQVLVMDYGRRIAEGPPEQVLRMPEVVAAYVGE
jgi:branched-chain amino acid transport system ATP-binding protein